MRPINKTRKEYSQIIDQWRSSGLTRQEFCRENQYNFSTFDGWLRKVNRLSQPTSQKIVPLEIDRSSSIESKVGFEVLYPNGVRLVMTRLPHTEELTRIIHLYRPELCFR